MNRAPESHSVDAKVSETLLHFLDPLIDDKMLRDPEALQAVLRLGVVAWNLGSSEMSERKGKVTNPDDALGLLRVLASDPTATRDLRWAVEALLQRRRTIFGHDRRVIADAELVPDPQVGYRLRCQSSLPECTP